MPRMTQKKMEDPPIRESLPFSHSLLCFADFLCREDLPLGSLLRRLQAHRASRQLLRTVRLRRSRLTVDLWGHLFFLATFFFVVFFLAVFFLAVFFAAFFLAITHLLQTKHESTLCVFTILINAKIADHFKTSMHL
jgi:hypothetical protein